MRSVPLVLVGILIAQPASPATPVPLPYNFNGVLHLPTDPAFSPDLPGGYRSISDRGLVRSGPPGLCVELLDGVVAGSGLFYDVVDVGGVLDMIHVGNRNQVDNGLSAFDLVPDGDSIGVQPSWLADVQQSTVAIAVDFLVDESFRLGLLHQRSNGGGPFNLRLSFADGSSTTVTPTAPDWFGPFNGTPPGCAGVPCAGIASEVALSSNYCGADLIDNGNLEQTLIVVESVISGAELLADSGFTVAGRRLVEIRLENPNPVRAIGLYAITIEPGVLFANGFE